LRRQHETTAYSTKPVGAAIHIANRGLGMKNSVGM
jgi:hypothetical protein